jgi:hypothetical protein
VLPIIEVFNDIFFFSALSLDFGWRALPEHDLGRACENGFIEMSPPNLLDEATTPATRAACPLQTLLHEIIHVYLLQFACRHCPTDDVNVGNADNHGRAFQILASALEDVVFKSLGWKLRIATLCEFSEHWEDVRHMPSMCDARRWNWLRE